jgi:hypothetical protein
VREIVKRETIGASMACMGGAVSHGRVDPVHASQWQFAISHDPGGKVTCMTRFTVHQLGASRQTGCILLFTARFMSLDACADSTLIARV